MPGATLDSRVRSLPWVLTLFGLWLMMTSSWAPARAASYERKSCEGEVCVHILQQADKVVFEASSMAKVPVGLRIEFDSLRNLASDKKLPFEGLVPPGKRVYVMKLVRQDPNRGASFPFVWRASHGNPKAIHDDDYLYPMPFGGREERVLTQGANGAFSHTGAHRYSWDFAMPIGTPILAARAGRVVHVADGYNESGTSEEFLPAANAVTVLHDDGTFATYAHLDPGAGVREGMWVRTGEVLGFSGNTGFSTGPHLHFAVWKGRYKGPKTIPIRFRGRRGQPIVPKATRAYRPGCHPEGRPCKPGERPNEARPASYTPPVERSADGTCRCRNGAVITTHLPCRAVCP